MSAYTKVTKNLHNTTGAKVGSNVPDRSKDSLNGPGWNPVFSALTMSQVIMALINTIVA